MRQFFVDTWQKATQNQPLDAMEQRVAKVIEMHPEYHAMLNNAKHLGNDYLPEMGETNPFLHMGMHLGLQEQVALNHPAGIQTIYSQLGQTLRDVHQTEHAMMDCLGEALWQAQQHGGLPDDSAYLTCLNRLIHAEERDDDRTTVPF